MEIGLTLDKTVYLDNAATTPLCKEAKEAMVAVLDEPFGNPSSTHAFGRKSRIIVEQCRKYIAKTLNCNAGEIIFTSGGTEADNAALALSIRDLKVERIITSRIEHHAVLHTAQQLARNTSVELVYVDLDEQGMVDLNHLERLLSEMQPTLVSLMHANNEIGNLLDLKETGSLCRKYGAYFHTDAVQSMGHLSIDTKEVEVDFISASAHKFYGPKGIGFLYANARCKIGSYITGGAQERNMRGGTENVMALAGMHAALKAILEKQAEAYEHISSLKAYLMDGLKAQLPDVLFNGASASTEKSMAKVLSVGFPAMADNNMLLFNLDLKGIAVSGGSACASGSLQGSHVIEAILPGVSYPIVRFSFGSATTKEDLDYALSALQNMQKT